MARLAPWLTPKKCRSRNCSKPWGLKRTSFVDEMFSTGCTHKPGLEVLHAFFISTATFRPRLGLLLNKTQIFSKLTLPYLTKRCLKCYLERVQSFGKGLMAQLSIFSEIRVSKLANFSLVLLIKVLLIKKACMWLGCVFVLLSVLCGCVLCIYLGLRVCMSVLVFECGFECISELVNDCLCV